MPLWVTIVLAALLGTIVTCLLLALFLFVLIYVPSNIPGTISSLNHLNKQLNGPWTQFYNGVYPITFDYPSQNWATKYSEVYSNIPGLSSPQTKCTGVYSQTNRIVFTICSYPNIEETEKLFARNDEYKTYGQNTYLVVRDGVDYEFGSLLIPTNRMFWIEFEHAYLSDNIPPENNLIEKILIRMVSSVRASDSAYPFQ